AAVATRIPPSPWIGSTKTAAVSREMLSFAASSLLKGMCVKSGTRGSKLLRYLLSQVADSAPWVLPWKPPLMATIFLLLVLFLASLIAHSTDSAPLLLRKNRFIPLGVIVRSFETSLALASLYVEPWHEMSLRAWSAIASDTLGCAWPTMHVP